MKRHIFWAFITIVSICTNVYGAEIIYKSDDMIIYKLDDGTQKAEFYYTEENQTKDAPSVFCQPIYRYLDNYQVPPTLTYAKISTPYIGYHADYNTDPNITNETFRLLCEWNTTSLPKGIVITYSRIIFTADNTVQALSIGTYEVGLICNPPEYPLSQYWTDIGENPSGEAEYCSFNVTTNNIYVNEAVGESQSINEKFTSQLVSHYYRISTGLKSKSESTNKNFTTFYPGNNANGFASLVINYRDNQVPTVSITSPSTGNILMGGIDKQITWTAGDNMGLNYFDLYFSSNNGSTWDYIGQAAGDKRSYSWLPPNINSSQCKIKIVAYDLAGFNATSITGAFTIKQVVLPVNAWLPIHSGSAPIKDIQMIDDTNAWAVGNDGLVLRQTGSSWNKITITGLAEYNLNAIEMKGQYGWIVGEKKDEPGKYTGVIRRSIDYGNTWPVEYEYKLYGTAFKDVSFANNGTGYIACGNGIILKSTNRGIDWAATGSTPITEPSGVSGWFNNIYTDPVNSANVRVACDNFGFINHSNNGGDTWSGAPARKTLSDNYYKWPDDTYFDYTLTLAPSKMGHSSWGTWSGSFNHGYIFNGSAFNQIVPDITNGVDNVPSGIWLSSLGGNEFAKSKYVGSDGFVHNSSDYGQIKNNVDLYASSCEDNSGYRKYFIGGSDGIIYTNDYLPPNNENWITCAFVGGTKRITLTWYPMQELEVSDYDVYRSTSDIGFVEKIGSVDATGSSSYTFTDLNAQYKMPYHYWLKVIRLYNLYNNEPSYSWVYLGSWDPSTGDPVPAPPSAPYNLIVADVLNDHGESVLLNWQGTTVNGYYIGRRFEGETTYKSFRYSSTNSYLDISVQNGRRYEYIVQALGQYYQPSASSVSAMGAAFDNLAPNKLSQAPTGGYSVSDKVMTIDWLPSSDEPNLGGYWVCPEPMGVFAEKISGIDPGEYEPDAYHVSHASPIERTQWKWRVPDELVGQTLIFSVTAMDRSGNIAPWSDQVFLNTKVLTNSNTILATAYNNGKHLVYDDKGRLFLVYGSGDSVLYQQSWDDGITWTPSSGFASGGIKPVPAIGYYGEDTTMLWKAETENVGWVLKSAKRAGNGWLPEETILAAAGSWEQTHYVSPPSMAINNAGTHLAIERVDAQYQIGGQSGTWYWKLLYGFKAAGQTAYAWTVLDSASGSWGGQDPNLASPTICLDSKGGVHVAWDYEGEIYWRGYDPYLGAWKEKINLTNSPDIFSAEPSLAFFGDVHIVWQEGNDIQHRKGNWGYPRLENTIDAIIKSFYWQNAENVSNNPATASLNPVFDGNYVAWSEQSAVDPDHYNAFFANYSDYVWTPSLDYSKNPSQPAVYPQIAYRQNVDGNKMTTIWTEGTGPLYSLIARDEAGQVTAQAAADVGGEEASIYLIERDGYIVYGASDAIASTGIITVDYDSTALEYYLPTLDRDQKQTMKFTFYQEYADKADYIYQVWVDDVSLGSVKVPSGQSVVFEKDLPNSVTHDGEGIVKIVNLKKDKIVTCDKWELYAYDKATGRGGAKKSGGAQLAEEGGKPLTYVYAMAQNAPNPFNGQTRISYQLAKPGNVSLKIYNTLGQLVNTLVDGQQQPGIYSASWNGKDNSGRTAANGVYIYRLESGDFKATKKMVVIK